MHASLTSLLLASGALTALVGNRIFWKKLEPDATFPRLVMHTISSPRDYNMQQDSGLGQTRIQIDIWAESYLSAQQVKAALVSLLSGYSGTHSTTKFDGIFIVDERDAVDDENTPTDLFGVQLDLIIWHKEI